MFSRDIPGHSVVHHWNRFSQYVCSELSGRGTNGKEWPTKTDLCCWHCTEPFDTQPIGIPLNTESDGRVICDGNFCSYPCALAYAFTFKTSHSQYKTRQLLIQCANDIHGISEVQAAPPTLSLKKFGGPLTIEQFRNSKQLHSIVVNPPFASQDMVYEIHSQGDCDDAETNEPSAKPSMSWGVAGLRPPDEPLSEKEIFCESEPLCDEKFSKFVDAKKKKSGNTTQNHVDIGNLSQFVKPKK